jgi:hypothetical protein
VWAVKIEKPHPYAYFVIALLLVAVVVTSVTDLPASPPDVALGSDALLYVERGLAILLAVFLIFVVLVQAWKGRLPTEISRDGFKYPPLVDPETVEDMKGAAELKVSSSEWDPNEESPEKSPEDMLALRLKLEAKLTYIAKFLLRPDECDCATFFTIGSLNFDGFLSDREARTATQVLTMRDEELDTLAPHLRRDFLRDADKVVSNIRASVFFGLVRTTLKKNGWAVEDLRAGEGRRPDLLAEKGSRCYRVVPRFSIKSDPERITKVKRRLIRHRDEAPESKRDIVVLPDRTRNKLEAETELAVVKFAGLKAMLGLKKDPRSLA